MIAIQYNNLPWNFRVVLKYVSVTKCYFKFKLFKLSNDFNSKRFNFIIKNSKTEEQAFDIRYFICELYDFN